VTENIYPTYYELCKSAPTSARKAIIRAYEERGNISEVARLFRTTRKTVRKVVRGWKETLNLKWGGTTIILLFSIK